MMSELLIQQFNARYRSAISQEYSLAASCRRDRFAPEPVPKEWANALKGWGDGLRFLLIGHPRRWPTGWTMSIPTDELRLLDVSGQIGKVQTIGVKGSRFEHRIYKPTEFNQIVKKL